ncbi:hypothetical protein M422DRAFT_272756 [Sphaerobolus stellatus SS14]|uniref:Uncharacterized protein n=1 Tax=Sphaerobolus stellatus (strain SS14) TaxID=990650 RepID=A0A0C9TAP1_SPHS4|nr:hypothetical protein M422DRAFT_272756 [Sphaerobolus stellatus SS14]
MSIIIAPKNNSSLYYTTNRHSHRLTHRLDKAAVNANGTNTTHISRTTSRLSKELLIVLRVSLELLAAHSQAVHTYRTWRATGRLKDLDIGVDGYGATGNVAVRIELCWCTDARYRPGCSVGSDCAAVRTVGDALWRAAVVKSSCGQVALFEYRDKDASTDVEEADAMQHPRNKPRVGVGLSLDPAFGACDSTSDNVTFLDAAETSLDSKEEEPFLRQCHLRWDRK